MNAIDTGCVEQSKYLTNWKLARLVDPKNTANITAFIVGLKLRRAEDTSFYFPVLW